MLRWSEFATAAPELAGQGRALLHQHGIGLGYLGTLRSDGAPRLHPFCPIQAAEGLYGLIGPSPKQHDLLRDGRYAIHAFPMEDRDDEFFVSGRAVRIHDPAVRAQVVEYYVSTGGGTSDNELLFEFLVDRALFAAYKPRGEPDNWPPVYTKWQAPPG